MARNLVQIQNQRQPIRPVSSQIYRRRNQFRRNRRKMTRGVFSTSHRFGNVSAENTNNRGSFSFRYQQAWKRTDGTRERENEEKQNRPHSSRSTQSFDKRAQDDNDGAKTTLVTSTHIWHTPFSNAASKYGSSNKQKPYFREKASAYRGMDVGEYNNMDDRNEMQNVGLRLGRRPPSAPSAIYYSHRIRNAYQMSSNHL